MSADAPDPTPEADADRAGELPTLRRIRRAKPSAAQLAEMIRLHERYVEARPGGRRCNLQHADLAGADLAGRKLAGIDLTGAVLIRARLAGSDLRDASLFAADLRFADLSECDLTRADMRGCNLRQADFTRATLVRAALSPGWIAEVQSDGDIKRIAGSDRPVDGTGARFRTTDLTGAKLNNATLMKADLRDAVMRGADLSGSDLRGAELSNAVLENANLSGANCAETRLQGAVLLGVICTGAVFTGADFLGALIDDQVRAAAPDAANLPGGGQAARPPIYAMVESHELWIRSAGKQGARLSCDGADLRGVDLAERDVSGAVMANCDLRGAKLVGLRGFMLDLSNSNLEGADLENADLRGSTLNRTHFADANLVKARFDALHAAQPGVPPVLTRSDGARFWRSNLMGARFDEAVLSGVDFAGAILTGARFDDAQIRDVRARGALDARFETARQD